MKKSFYSLISIMMVVGAVLFNSCVSSREQFAYMQDLNTDSTYEVQKQRMSVVQPGDRLDIKIFADNSDLTLPFNEGGGYRIKGDNISQGQSVTLSSGYLVDEEGEIDYPVFGKVRVTGMTLQQVGEIIKSKIVLGKYISDPRVTVELLNFKAYMLGAAGGKIITDDDGQINLLQAIAQAGDLGTNARLDNIRVIREVNGERQVYEHDIKSKSVYDSPAFYLQQNDLIYVEPKHRQRDEITNVFRYTSIIMSALSFATTIIYLFK